VIIAEVARPGGGRGMRCGQVLGSNDALGRGSRAPAGSFRDVFATLYQRLGIDVAATQFNDMVGRPHYLVGEHRPLPELIGQPGPFTLWSGQGFQEQQHSAASL